MRSASLSRRSRLLIVIISPALFGSYFKCVAVSNPTVATARIEVMEPIALRVGDVMRVTGSGNGAPPLQFAWDFGDGAQAGGMQATHAYMAPGSYRVTLIVRDAVGSTASDFSQVSVSGRTSSALLTMALLSPAVAGQPVLFEASPPQNDAAHALTYVWTFSDGQSAVGPRPAATFAAAGMYTASVTVESDRGAVAGARMVFHVVEGAR
jgi:chitodextrinase